MYSSCRLEQIRVTDKSNRFHSEIRNPEKIKSEYVGLDEKRKKGLRVPWYTALDEDISDQVHFIIILLRWG